MNQPAVFGGIWVPPSRYVENVGDGRGSLFPSNQSYVTPRPAR